MTSKLNPAKTKQIKVMLNQLKLMAYSADYALEVSNMRTWHVSELNEAEANLMINALKAKIKAASTVENDKSQKQRRRIISMCHEMGLKTSTGTIDMTKVNALVAKYGHKNKAGHKVLNDYTVEELPKLVTQFERMKEYHLHKKTAARQKTNFDDAISRDHN